MMSYIEFLKTIQVLKMLYGRDIAEKVFTKNLGRWYNIDSESLIKLVKKDKK